MSGSERRIGELFAGDDHIDVQATWSVYQRMSAAYREPGDTPANF